MNRIRIYTYESNTTLPALLLIKLLSLEDEVIITILKAFQKADTIAVSALVRAYNLCEVYSSIISQNICTYYITVYIHSKEKY